MQLVVVVAAVKDDGCVHFRRTVGRSEKLWGRGILKFLLLLRSNSGVRIAPPAKTVPTIQLDSVLYNKLVCSKSSCWRTLLF